MLQAGNSFEFQIGRQEHEFDAAGGPGGEDVYSTKRKRLMEACKEKLPGSRLFLRAMR